MKNILKKTLIAALPLAGLLLTAPAAFARPHHHHRHHQWGYRDDCHPSYGRGRYDRWSYHNDRYDRRGRYGGRWDDRYDDYYRSRYPRPFYSEPWRWQSFLYR